MNLQIKQKFLILTTILYQCCIYPFQSALQLIFQGLWEKKVSDKEYSNLSQLDKVLQILVSYKHVPIPSTNSKKKKKKEKTRDYLINRLDFSSSYYLVHAFYLPLYFNAKLKVIQEQGSSKEQCSGQATKVIRYKSDYGLCQFTPFQVTLAKLGPQCIYNPDLTHLGLLAITLKKKKKKCYNLAATTHYLQYPGTRMF